ncbi:DNA-binding transcription factor [Lithospermum erythrorhizon]|uniref:DNA-binding transcription factor n=1 Tax=Lithospermum erythrorhizon TaxID=34254 RepID=A0AAV3RJ31_LITER
MSVKQENSAIVGLVESPPQCSDGVATKRARDKDQCIKGVSKKRYRKTLVRWTERVRVTNEIGLEGALKDGYSWRKYGQKQILGATHPRLLYYRCTHRHTRGCMAKKQVQRLDEDSSMVEVTYNGNHTCLDTSLCASSLMAMGIEKPKEITKQQLEVKQINEHFPAFSPFQSENLSIWEKLEEDIIFCSCSPGFQSSLSYKSNYLTTSPRQMNLYSIESDLCHVVSTLSSVENPAFQFDLPVEMEFDVAIDNIEYYFS